MHESRLCCALHGTYKVTACTADRAAALSTTEWLTSMTIEQFTGVPADC